MNVAPRGEGEILAPVRTNPAASGSETMSKVPIMSDQSCAPSIPAEPQHEPAGKPVFVPYDAPAGGWGALHATARALREKRRDQRNESAAVDEPAQGL